MEKLNNLLKTQKNLLSVYFTAGYPKLNSTLPVLEALEAGGADFVEIGMPYSDPLADGPVIQQSSKQALDNGMSINLLFEQLQNISTNVTMPLILMGYLNPILRFGMEAFLEKCKETGINGLIIPDLPYESYAEEYESLFSEFEISNIFLITPQTPEERIQKLDKASTTFLYMVSSAAVTGARDGLSDQQIEYFERINDMNLRTPRMVGFGISNHQTFSQVCEYAHGAIVGSAFIKHLGPNEEDPESIKAFIQQLKEG